MQLGAIPIHLSFTVMQTQMCRYINTENASARKMCRYISTDNARHINMENKDGVFLAFQLPTAC